MQDRDEPPTRPWPAIPPASPARGAGGLFADPDWDPYYPAQAGGTANEARDLGLRRLSMLTLHATGLSVVTAIGFTTVFASTAHPQASTVVAATPTPGPATASGTPSPGPVPKAHKKKHHHQAAAAPAAAAPAAATTGPAAPAPAATPASAPTLAPPTTAPAAAAPGPAPAQTTSSGSVPA
jgi:hypothetical protein